MALTKEQRDRLPSEDFAVPKTRQLPMQDEKHARMAWDMVDNTKGLSDEERRVARSRVLARARKLGVDVSEWNKIKAMSLEAMSLEVPSVNDHPNRAPFSGVLTRVDEASDLAPHGSYGRKILLPKEVAEKALPSLLGMAVNVVFGHSGHDRKKKIGVITAATIDGSAVNVSGFFYANDFPEEVSMIQADKENLGFSFEAERILVEDVNQDPIRIESMVFTGAAVLLKKRAAYHSTSLAASAEEKQMEKEQFDAIIASVAALGGRIDTLEKTRLEAASVADKVAKHADMLRECAAQMSAAGIGQHQTRGHAAVLNHMADEIMAEAHRGSIPSEYRAMSMYGSAETRTVVTAKTAEEIAAEAKTKKELETLQASVASLTTTIKDLQAASAAGSPERKTIPPRLSSLMAKGNMTLAAGEKLSVAKIDTVLKGTSLNPQERMELKIGLERAGLMDQAA